MHIIGCDLHTRQQTLAILDIATGALEQRVLEHNGNNVEQFYSTLEGPVCVGIEATGPMQWFLELMEKLHIECRVGHPAKIRAHEPRKQKNDRRDAKLLLDLLVEDRFPEIWMPSSEQRDIRALLRYRHQWVRVRSRLQHALQSIALNHGLRMGSSLWSKAGLEALFALPLDRYASQRRESLIALYRQLQEDIQALDKQVSAVALDRPKARLLMTHPGVGPITALATEVYVGDATRFVDGKALSSYVGMIPSEDSSAGKQRLGRLTKEGNAMLRFLWCEAARHAVVKDEELKRFYRRKLAQKGLGKATVAAGRKLGIRLWIMLRDNIDYEEFCRRGRRDGGSPCGMPDDNVVLRSAVTVVPE
jgi:transposase